jgi:hypothetical protein
MKTEQAIVLGVGIAVVVLAAAYEATNGFQQKARGAEITPESLKLGTGNPPLWIFYNDSDVNSRYWWDFGARDSRVINIPLLNTFYNTIVAANGDKYRIEVIGGLQGVAERLGPDALPDRLRNPRARVSVAEEDWIRAAILKKYGGLWLSPSVICLRGFGELPKDRVVGFGQDTVPLYGSSVPGFRALWVPQAEHPMMVDWEARCRDRLDNQLGGQNFRGDAKSDWVDLSSKYACEVRYTEELSRNPRTNKSLDLEQIFAAGTEGNLPFTVPPTTVYVVVPYEDLLDRRVWGWALRSSEKQIMESDLVIRYLLEMAVRSGHNSTEGAGGR